MFKNIIKTFRIKQWVKNGFLFAAIIFDGQLFNIDAFSHTFAGFLVFCLLSSSVYTLNDVFDKEADKQHPIKRSRPIASGKIPLKIAVFIALLMSSLALIAAYFLSLSFLMLCGVYLLMNILYSKWLKHIPILDVMIIAAGFVLRVAAGVSLIKVDRFSPWLYVVTTLLSLFIGFGKRRANLPENHSMMLTIPFVLYGIFRYLYLIQIEQSGGAPEELVLKDNPLKLSVLFYGISVLIIFYFL